MSTDAQVVGRSAWAAFHDAHDRAGWCAHLTDDCVYRELPTGQVAQGGDAVSEATFAWLGVMSDLHGDIENLIACGDQVVIETAYTGTHDGSLRLPDGRVIPPTGTKVGPTPACVVYRLRDGAIAEIRHDFDMSSVLAAIGAAAR